MTVLTTIALATLLLKDDYLVTLHERCEHLANDLGTLKCRGTYLNFIVGFGEEHTVKFYGVSFFERVAEIVNIQELVGLCLELLSLDLYDSVHLLFCCVTGYTAGRTDVGQIPFHCLTCPVRLNRLQN